MIFDKRSRRWSSLGVSPHAHAVYPAQVDPYNESLIWFGANDGPPDSILDWIGFRPTGAVDDPLVFSGSPGGLGLIDTRERTIRYFGPFRDLVSGRVSRFLFDADAVWIWGRQLGNQELDGIARFDRASQTFTPYPIESKGVDAGWVVDSFTDSGSSLSLAVRENREWYTRYEFDKVARRWRTMRYGWVLSQNLPLLERPDERSPRIDLLRAGRHFGKQGHDHYGHPIVILEETAEWQRVVTCTNAVGWVRSGGLVDSVAFVRGVLREPATARDVDNEGPRMFLARVHLYLTRAEAHDVSRLFRAAATPPNVKAGAGRLDSGLKMADEMWEAFERRRSGLR